MKKFLFVFAVVIMLSFLCSMIVLAFSSEYCCEVQSFFEEGSQVIIQDETPLATVPQEVDFPNVPLGIITILAGIIVVALFEKDRRNDEFFQ